MQTPQNQTQMVASKAGQKQLVTVQALRTFTIGNPAEPEIIEAGRVVQIEEPLAKELCDKSFDGPYPFSGERTTGAPEAKPGKILRAKRISEEEAKAIQKASA